MKELKKNYEEEIKELRAELKDCPLDIEKETRLETKINCYKEFLIDIEVLKYKNVENYIKRRIAELTLEMNNDTMDFNKLLKQNVLMNW